MDFPADTTPHDLRAARTATPVSTSKERIPLTLVLGVAAVLACAFSARMASIDSRLPYVSHVDEKGITQPAAQILKSGDLNPHFFRYPSVSIYVATAGMAAGFVRAAAHGEVQEVRHLGSVVHPFYRHPRVVGTARALFALLSLVPFLVAVSLGRTLRVPSAAILVVLVALALSSLYFMHSWKYLNVDIVAAAAASWALWWFVETMNAESVGRWWLSGLAVGLAASCKYTMGVLLLSGVAAIVLTRDRRCSVVAALGSLVVGAAMGFVVGTPYALLDVPGFLNGLAFEAHHYASHHFGRTSPTGWPQLAAYVRSLVESFGLATAPLAALGMVAMLMRRTRETIVLWVFPVVLLALLASQPVFFARNALAIHVLYALCIGAGVGVVPALVRRIMKRPDPTRRPKSTFARIAPGMVAISCLLALPFQNALAQLRPTPDSRLVLARWLAEHAEPGSVVVAPAMLGIDPRTLPRNVRLVTFSYRENASPARFAQRIAEAHATYVVFPNWRVDRRFRGGHDLDALRRLSVAGEVRAEMGTMPTTINVSTPISAGDPKIRLVEFRAPQPARTAEAP